ncbi:MAG: heme-binding domain-containing protein [Acidimicrobiia bacterium]
MSVLRKPRITRRGVLIALGVVAVAFALVQLVPYRVTNPPVGQEPPWDSPRTLALARAACFDCHSNETDPYWFEEIAPVSWLITRDVNAGRDALNFSECEPHESEDGDDVAEVVIEEEMPPSMYTLLWLHPDAELSATERQELADGLSATLAGWRCEGD